MHSIVAHSKAIFATKMVVVRLIGSGPIDQAIGVGLAITQNPFHEVFNLHVIYSLHLLLLKSLEQIIHITLLVGLFCRYWRRLHLQYEKELIVLVMGR